MTPENNASGNETETSSRRLSECTQRLQEAGERGSANR